MSTADIFGLITSITALLGVIGVFLKLRQEQPGTRADLANQYMQMATNQAKENAELRRCQDEFERRMDELERQFAEEVEYNRQLEEYVSELVQVMKSAGLQPLRPRPERRTRPRPAAQGD